MSSRGAAVVDRPRALTLIRELVRYHPLLFLVSMLGAWLFAICTVASSWALRWVIDEVVLPRFDAGDTARGGLFLGTAILIGIAVLRASAVIIRRTWAGRVQWRTAESLTGEVVDTLIAQPAPWHRRQNAGDLITRAGVDIDATVGILAPLPYASSVLVMMVIAAIGLFAMDPVLAIVAVSVFPILLFANVWYQRTVDKWFALAQNELGDLSSAVHESFEAITVVKAFGAEESETRRLGSIAARVREARVHAIRLRSTFDAILDLLPNATNVLLVLLGAQRVNAGQLTVGGLASFIYLFALLVFPLRIVGYALSELPRSQAGYARIRSLTDQPKVDDPRNAILYRTTSDALRGSTIVTVHEVSASHLVPGGATSASMPEPGSPAAVLLEPQPVLHEMTFTITRGSVTAIVGPTGCGKSTLIEVLAGILPVTSGHITSHAGSVAVVFQEPFLLGASILDNIAMGRACDIADIDVALEIAEARFVKELPQDVHTIVGERGVSLSGGQRQRVALARAVLGRPDLLLLDDTTSSLDPVTEKKVVENLRRDLPETTLVTVASRPSLIRNADDVLYMEGGTIVARGSHDDLMQRIPAYRDLITAYERERREDSA